MSEFPSAILDLARMLPGNVFNLISLDVFLGWCFLFLIQPATCHHPRS